MPYRSLYVGCGLFRAALKTPLFTQACGHTSFLRTFVEEHISLNYITFEIFALQHMLELHWCGYFVTGESIPIRLFMNGYDLTPTMRDVNKKFSVRYYLNLVLVDDEDRRYFKQQVCSCSHNSCSFLTINRVTTCLENLEMSGNLTVVREMSGILLTVTELSGKKSHQEKVA